MAVIDGPDAPTQINFPVELSGNETIRVNEDGTADVYGDDGAPVAGVDADLRYFGSRIM